MMIASHDSVDATRPMQSGSALPGDPWSHSHPLLVAKKPRTPDLSNWRSLPTPHQLNQLAKHPPISSLITLLPGIPPMSLLLLGKIRWEPERSITSHLTASAYCLMFVLQPINHLRGLVSVRRWMQKLSHIHHRHTGATARILTESANLSEAEVIMYAPPLPTNTCITKRSDGRTRNCFEVGLP
jgi:hypothetical protein